MSKKISFLISFLVFSFFGSILLLPTLNPIYKKNELFNFFSNLENIFYDIKIISKGPVKSHDDIVIVGIDEESIAKIGRWPWSRDKFVHLSKELLSYNPKMIAYDIVFSEEEVNEFKNVSEEIKKIFSTEKTALTEEISKKLELAAIDHDADSKFSEVIKESTDKLIFGYMFIQETLLTNELRESEKYQGNNLKSNLLLRKKEEATSLEPIFTSYTNVINSISQYSDVLKHEGFLNGESDSDSIYRRSHLVYKFKDKVFPSISLKMYSLYKNIEIASIKTKSLENLIVFDDLTLIRSNPKETIPINVDLQGSFYVNYRGPKYSFPHYSIANILSEDSLLVGKKFNPKTGAVESFSLKKKDAFKDKVILIGATASLLSDIRPTPFNKRNYPGVEIHATVLDNLIKGDYLQKSESQYIIQFFLMFLLALFLCWLVVSFSYSYSFFIFISMFFLIGLVDFYYFFLAKGIVTDISLIFIQAATTYGFLLLYRYFVEEKDNRFLINTFKSYLSPELIDSMYKAKELPSLGGETRFMTAFFSDVQGFSTFSEQLTPGELVSWLNEYLTAMTDILIDEMGTLDKYEGDAIVAFFGAPVEYQDHAERACRVAIRMQMRLQEMRKDLESHKGDQIKKIIRQTRARVGLNTGNMLTGNVGSKQRMNYTMMGHAVNLASRLESSAKQYGIFVQITEATKKEVEGKFLVRRIDLILVMGVSDPIQTYELLDFIDTKNENLELLGKNFEKGIDLYNEKKWDEALEFFEKSLDYEKYRLSFDPDQTNPSKIYINRCQNFKKNQPPKEWNGVYVLESK